MKTHVLSVDDIFGFSRNQAVRQEGSKKEAFSKLSAIFLLERHFGKKNEDLSGLIGLDGRRGLRT